MTIGVGHQGAEARRFNSANEERFKNQGQCVSFVSASESNRLP